MTVNQLSSLGLELDDIWLFYIYLDVGTTVALAQLQLLRDAMIQNWPVEVGYVGPSPDGSILREAEGGYPAYTVTVLPSSRIRDLTL